MYSTIYPHGTEYILSVGLKKKKSTGTEEKLGGWGGFMSLVLGFGIVVVYSCKSSCIILGQRTLDLRKGGECVGGKQRSRTMFIERI